MKQRIVAMLWLLAFMVGCAPQVHYRTQQFRIVDGITHLPLEGVNAHRASFPSDGRLSQVLEGSYPKTGPDGLVTIRDLMDIYVNVVRFDKEGYQPADVNIGPDFGLKNSRWDHAVLSSPITEAKIQTGKRVPLEQTLTIPLFRQNSVPTSKGR